MKTYKIKAAIFDMDGVITNTMPDHFRAWKMVLSAHMGFSPTYLDIYTKEGSPGTDCLIDIFAKYEKKYDEEIGRKILAEKEKVFKEIVRIRYITGARRFLKHLKQRKILLALVTGTSRQELIKILPDHLYELFSVVITGSDVTKGKPHPEPYLKAITQLYVQPHEAVVFENAPFGVTSAKKAGLSCLALETSLPQEYLREADHVFKDIKDLISKVTFEKIL